MKENQKEEQKADPLGEISSITRRHQIFLFSTRRRRKELRGPVPSEKVSPIRVRGLGAWEKQHFLGSVSVRQLPETGTHSYARAARSRRCVLWQFPPNTKAGEIIT